MNAPLADVVSSPQPQAETMPRSTFFRWRWRVRRLKDASAKFDLNFFKRAACFLALTALAWSIPNTTVQEIVPWTVMFASILAAAYFGHILFFRLQCSLLEFCVIIAALGNLEGMLLTTPGVFTIGKAWLMVLAPLIFGWIFYGAAIGLVQAELCGWRGPLLRIFHIVAGWLSTGALAMLMLGALLWLNRQETRFITKSLAAWAIPMLAAGATGLLLRMWIGWKSKRVAKQLIYESVP